MFLTRKERIKRFFGKMLHSIAMFAFTFVAVVFFMLLFVHFS